LVAVPSSLLGGGPEGPAEWMQREEGATTCANRGTVDLRNELPEVSWVRWMGGEEQREAGAGEA
jgi:hypothetical protein